MNDRQILYSPGIGSGWTTWYNRGDRVVRKFMLEYRPWVDRLLMGGRIDQELEDQFLLDFAKYFPTAEEPYTGSIHGMRVMSVPYGKRVYIYVTDRGQEVVVVEGSDDPNWL